MQERPDELGPQGVEAAESEVVDAATEETGAEVRKTFKEIVDELPEVDPKVAYANLKEALKIVKGKGFKVKKGDVYFASLPGQEVGEATPEGITIDPIMLMHPAARLAHVIAHEIAHVGGRVDPEGLVEAYVRLSGFGESGGLEATKKYEEALENFYLLVDKLCGEDSEDKDKVKMINKLYKLYYNEKYEEIYDLFEENYMNNLVTDKEKDDAFKLFGEVFPELHVRGGRFDTWGQEAVAEVQAIEE